MPGIGVGVASSIPSVLLAEVATAETRGTITTLHQVGVTFGIFVSALLGYAFVTYVNHGWQYIQVVTCDVDSVEASSSSHELLF